MGTPQKKGNILVVDDNQSVLTSIELLLQEQFKQVNTLKNPANLISSIREQQTDVILLDMNFKAGINSGNEGIHLLRTIARTDPDISVVLDVVPYATIDEQLPIQVETGEGPDLARITNFAAYRGKLLDLEVEKEHGRIIYELEFLDPQGRVREYEVDAETGDTGPDLRRARRRIPGTGAIPPAGGTLP